MICMALGFKRTYRCRNLHTDEGTPILAKILWDSLFLPFPYNRILGSQYSFDVFQQFVDIFLLMQKTRTSAFYQCEEHTVVGCVLSLRIETKGAGN